MAKTVQITLGGTEYTVPRLNIGELEELTEIVTSTPATKLAFQVLGIALRRAKPSLPEDIKSIETDGHEIKEALSRIMILAGMKDPDSANPPQPPAAPGASRAP